jgi:hypothetical protein
VLGARGLLDVLRGLELDALEQLLRPRLVERHLLRGKRVEDPLLLLDPDHVESALRERQCQRQADTPEPYDGD